MVEKWLLGVIWDKTTLMELEPVPVRPDENKLSANDRKTEYIYMLLFNWGPNWNVKTTVGGFILLY